MSDLLRKLAGFVRASHSPELHVVSGQDWSDDDAVLSDADPKVGKAEPVGWSGEIPTVSVGDGYTGDLEFFMDGIERRHVPLYFSMVPVVYGYVAAAIRRRGGDRLMRRHVHESHEALYFPHRLVDPETFAPGGIASVNTETDEKQLDEHPLMLREAARKAISKTRGRIETQLARRWLEEFAGSDSWLVVDGSLGGTLGGDYRKYESPNILGLIKSHQTQYFAMSEQRKILSLRAGERTGVFMPLGREHQAPVYSWYLRLRRNDGQDVYFGLMRVEAPADDRTLEMVDEISRWLLAERCPLSLPDSRWDRMLYPIRDCEQYLKSLAPTRTMLEASMMGGLHGAGRTG